MDLLTVDIPGHRLRNQHLTGDRFPTPQKLVAWMGALQAQDYAMARWALGIRLPDGTSRSAIQQAIDRGDIIRTHVLRPTWHFVAAKDAAWMLELTAPHIKASMRSRLRELELTPAVLKKSFRIIENALRDGDHLTREELVTKLAQGRVDTSDQRAAHVLFYAELDKIMCSGAMRDKKITYALFATRVKSGPAYEREEALANLFERYFNSHGPATLQDFIWWSGLPVRDARIALDLGGARFDSETIGTRTYFFKEQRSNASEAPAVHFLPAFDEYIISYKDRSACLPPRNHADTISRNGMFSPVILVNGIVIGTWRKNLRGRNAKVESRFFKRSGRDARLRKLLDEAAARAEAFFTVTT